MSTDPAGQQRCWYLPSASRRRDCLQDGRYRYYRDEGMANNESRAD